MTDEKKRSREADEDCWVMILKVGPFEQWANSVAFLNLWTSKTRGKMRRLERGIELFNNYKDLYRLKLWLQPNDRSSSLEQFYRHTQIPPAIVVKEEPEEEEAFLCENEDDVTNNMSLADMKSIFGSSTLDTISVRTIKDAHNKLESTSKKKKQTEKKK